ncbi:hypothetical protein [Bradyrhizobium elkanii]|uniref:hypothetical protein n=1 Tax=Bradyrhizobium elkanii TaxID=29448 RepID=UPI002225EF83|nr:hypothetical protein [Bradyrhizobium elkanii]MCW2228119.1 hypothetical protein [Bradyrhizobium elkanii]
MNRSSWKFTYTADKLFAAADAKKDWHMERLKWWSDKRKEVEATIRSEGIEIDESVAANIGSLNYSNSVHRGPSVNIRNDLVRDLSECVSKTQEHEAKCREYDAWMQVLGSQGQASLDLNQDDWLFFFGK